jgi:hypothetical protein
MLLDWKIGLIQAQIIRLYLFLLGDFNLCYFIRLLLVSRFYAQIDYD